MGKLRKHYSKEKKLEIVKLSLEEDSRIKELGERFDVHPNTISRWCKEYRADAESCFPGNGNGQLTADEKEVKKLKKEIREVKLERDILKKAISTFSKSDGKSTNS